VDGRHHSIGADRPSWTHRAACYAVYACRAFEPSAVTRPAAVWGTLEKYGQAATLSENALLNDALSSETSLESSRTVKASVEERLTGDLLDALELSAREGAVVLEAEGGRAGSQGPEGASRGRTRRRTASYEACAEGLTRDASQ
jgi:hypothetical protein